MKSVIKRNPNTSARICRVSEIRCSSKFIIIILQTRVRTVRAAVGPGQVWPGRSKQIKYACCLANKFNDKCSFGCAQKYQNSNAAPAPGSSNKIIIIRDCVSILEIKTMNFHLDKWTQNYVRNCLLFDGCIGWPKKSKNKNWPFGIGNWKKTILFD